MSGRDDALAAIAVFDASASNDDYHNARKLAEPYAFEFGAEVLRLQAVRRSLEERLGEQPEPIVALSRMRKKRSPIVWIEAGRYLCVAKVERSVYRLEGEGCDLRLYVEVDAQRNKAFVANVRSLEAASRKIRALRRSKR